MKKSLVIIIAVLMLGSFMGLFFSPGSDPNVNSGTGLISNPMTGLGSAESVCTKLVGSFGTDAIVYGNVSHSEYDVVETVDIEITTVRLTTASNTNFDGTLLVYNASNHDRIGEAYANYTEGTGYTHISSNFSRMFYSPINLEFCVVLTGYNVTNTSSSSLITISSGPKVTITSSQEPSTLFLNSSDNHLEGYVDTNTTVAFASSVTGGYTPYSYQWYMNGTKISGATSPTYSKTFVEPGIYHIINAAVTDATGYCTISNVITEHVAYPPKVNLTANNTQADTNQPVEFFSNLIHGNGNLNITWTVNGNPVSGSPKRDMNMTFPDEGKYDVKVTVTDQANVTVSSNITEVVYPPLSGHISIPKYIDQGQDVNYKLNLTGSSGVIISSFYCLKEAVEYGSSPIYAEGNGTSFNYTYPLQLNLVAPYNKLDWCPIYLNLTFRAETSTGAKIYQNIPDIELEDPPKIQISGQFSSVDAGINDTFSPSPGYVDTLNNTFLYAGWSPYVVIWQAENTTSGIWTNIANYSGASPVSIHHSFSKAGTYEVRAKITDAANDSTYSNEVQVTVNPALRLSVSINPSSVVDLHIPEVCSTIPIKVTTSGGSSLEVASILVNGVSESSNESGSTSPYTITMPMPQSPGIYMYCVFAKDITGGSARGYANFTVIPNNISITTDVPSIVVVGSAYSFSASASAPSYFSYQHDFNLISYDFLWRIGSFTQNGNKIAYEFSSTGNYTVNLSVKGVYETYFNGQETYAFQEKNISMKVRAVAESNSPDIRIKQVIFKAPSAYYFNYWVDLINSSYSTSFYEINGTSYIPQDVQTCVNGTVFVNVSVQDDQYAAGSYNLTFTVVNKLGQTNSVNGIFTVGVAQSDEISIYSIANFFGGFYNLIIFIATVGGLAIAYASLKDSQRPPVIQIPEKNGKIASYQLAGKELKKGGR